MSDTRAGASSRPNRGKRLRGGQQVFSHGTAEPNEPSAKKLRFDPRNPSNLVADTPDDDEDAILELDTIGKGGGAAKHSAVNLDGLESDSDDDNFNVRAAERARAIRKAKDGGKNGVDDDDDDDMFGEGEQDEVPSENDAELAVKKKKTVKFMENADIEGQEFGSTAGSKAFDIRDAKGRTKEDESDSESGGDEGRDYIGSEVDEEIGAGGKKKHAPRIDAFNMRAEGDEGKFDESGNFVRQADPNAIHDSWLEGVSKKEMKRAREAEEKREEDRRRRNREQDSLLEEDLLATLITRLQKGESVLEALQRLGRKSKQKPKWGKNKKLNRDDMDVESAEHGTDDAESKRKQAIDAITDAADALMTRGQEHIYDAERELLMRQYKRETGEDWADKSINKPESDVQWHFRWADARDGGIHHGPYDTQTMQSWIEAGYFGRDVEFQRVGADDWVKYLD
jgi:CD2 antigen cytoplasmic tail-binding protein 2